MVYWACHNNLFDLAVYLLDRIKLNLDMLILGVLINGHKEMTIELIKRGAIPFLPLDKRIPLI